MLDVSDGLARDVRRLAAASGVGVALEAVPVADGATLDEALGGGEDYELVVTHHDAAALVAAFVAVGLRAPVRDRGRGRGPRHPHGRRRAAPRRGMAPLSAEDP